MTSQNKKILLHVCCATCAAGCADTLKSLNFEEIVFFEFNPNIFPPEEHQKRASDLSKLSQMKEIPYYTGLYDYHAWLKKTQHLRDEEEGGERCNICFQIRME